jgi:hypothetical protein
MFLVTSCHTSICPLWSNWHKGRGFFVTLLSHYCHSHTLSTLTNKFLGIPKDSLGDRKDLSASQEDLSIQGQVIDEERRRYQEKEQRLTERFNRERDMFKGKGHVQGENRGAGTGVVATR